MAGNEYEYVDESSIDENYKCTVCNDPFNSPTTTPCDHTYCRECIERWLSEGYATCPSCRHPLSVEQLQPVTTRLILNILERLLVKCVQCGHSGIQRGNFSDHVGKLCPKGTTACAASDIKCPWLGPRDELEHHLATCQYEKLRPILSQLVSTNQQLQQQVRALTNEIKTLQPLVQSPTRRLITFDQLGETEKKADSGVLPDSYERLKWINAWYMHEQWVKTNHAQSGWQNAYTNGHTCVAFNGKGSPMSISSGRRQTDTFTLIALEATAAWLDDLNVTITGRRLGQALHTTTAVLQFDQSRVFNFDWKDIDEIQLVPTSGRPHPGVNYTDTYFALTWILLG